MNKKTEVSLNFKVTRKKISLFRWLAFVYIGILLFVAYYDHLLFGWGLLLGDIVILFLFLKGYGFGSGSWLKMPNETTIIQRVNLFLQIVFIGLMGFSLVLFGRQ